MRGGIEIIDVHKSKYKLARLLHETSVSYSARITKLRLQGDLL